MSEPNSIMHPIRNNLILIDIDYHQSLVAAFHALCLRVDMAGCRPTELEVRRVAEVRRIESRNAKLRICKALNCGRRVPGDLRDGFCSAACRERMK